MSARVHVDVAHAPARAHYAVLNGKSEVSDLDMGPSRSSPIAVVHGDALFVAAPDAIVF